jgi:hypothetical membrane protein
MTFLLHLHSGWRFFILLAAVILITKMIVGLAKKSDWGNADKILGLIYIILLDLQMIFGSILWIGGKHWSGADHWRSWCHPFAVLVGIAFAHIGFKKTKTGDDHGKRFKTGLICYSASIALILVGIYSVIKKLP